MRTKKFLLALNLFLVLGLLLSACGGAATPQVIERETIVTQIVRETEEIITTVEVEREVVITPTPEPVTRQGAWLDQLVFTGQNSAEAAVSQLQAGDLDIYAYTVDDPNLYQVVQNDENLDWITSFGSFNEITFNPAEYTDGRLNPFSNKKLREAMNYIVDRDYIVQEISGGLGKPKYVSLNSAFPDYARYAPTIRELEAKYAYNLELGQELITAEMEGMGAELVDGKWNFNGEPIVLVFLIRVEDERRQIGDYFANQLEAVGFTVDRQYKTSPEAAALWVQTDPAEGQWDVYTAGWISNFVDRDSGDDYSFYYTPNDYPIPLFQAYTPAPEFEEIALRLRNNDFETLEERDELFTQALRMSLEDSVRIFLNDSAAFTPFRRGLDVGFDLAAGVAGAQVWPFTIRWEGQEGGIAKISQPGILVEPWNPLAGTNWVYDAMPQRATSDYAVLFDPYTGLGLPMRLESAAMAVREGLPVVESLGWVDLTFEPEITVPEDAWYDWDPVNQTFITVGDSFTETVTANARYTVTYPADMFETVKWHDGSNISMADFLMGMILTFDQGKEESPIFDEAAAEALAAFFAHFKGFKILSTDRLTIETYSDQYQLDAEVSFAFNTWTTWWPQYTYGPGAWHNLVPGILAETEGELAFSSAKADSAQVEWTGFLSGPSLEIMKTYLDQAQAENYIPYAPTMSEYLTADEATARYTNLQAWYERKGHFWLGTGPFYVDQVFPVEGTLTLRRFPDYPDMADRWARFGEPKIAQADLSGPGNVTQGQEAAFDLAVSFEGEPFPEEEITQVTYLVFDATGALVASGDAEPAGDGQYRVVLSPEVTQGLEAGSNRLEVAVITNVVAIPTFNSVEFITAP